MRAFACPSTQEFFEYSEGVTFKVYHRKSNSTKKLIYVGTDVHMAWKYFLSIKLFRKDYKYLFYVVPHGTDEIRIKRHQGKDERPKKATPTISRDRKYIPLKGCALGPLRNMSKSLVKDLKAYCQLAIIGEKRIIELLLSEFLSFPVEDREQFLKDSQQFLDPYLLKDGGRLAEDFIEKREIQKAVREEILKKSDTIEDDLL